MRIEVTASDIVNGVPEDPCRCPIALALLRVTGKSWAVNDTYTAPVLMAPAITSPTERITLPDLAQSFVSGFDSGCRVKPFTFDLPIESQE